MAGNISLAIVSEAIGSLAPYSHLPAIKSCALKVLPPQSLSDPPFTHLVESPAPNAAFGTREEL